MDLDLARFIWLTFDCYGTLIDWETGIADALEPLIRRHGIAEADLDREALLVHYAEAEPAIQAESYRPYREVLRETVDRLCRGLDITPTKVERDCLVDSLPNWPPFADTVDALRRLQSRYKLAVLSNVDDDLFAGSAAHLGIAFDEVVTAEQVKSYKPAPAHFETAIERLGSDATRILHVAQSRYHDIAPATAIGLATVWVDRRRSSPGTGATPPATNATPDLTVPDLAALANLVGL